MPYAGLITCNMSRSGVTSCLNAVVAECAHVVALFSYADVRITIARYRLYKNTQMAQDISHFLKTCRIPRPNPWIETEYFTRNILGPVHQRYHTYRFLSKPFIGPEKVLFLDFCMVCIAIVRQNLRFPCRIRSDTPSLFHPTRFLRSSGGISYKFLEH